MAEAFAPAGADLNGPMQAQSGVTAQPAVGQAPVLDQSRKLPSSVIPNTSTTVTGIIPATGTTPTAGTGFTYTHTNGSGTYVFTFKTAFAAAPVVVAVGNTPAGTANIGFDVSGVTATGFTFEAWLRGTGALTDSAFSFLAYQVS